MASPAAAPLKTSPSFTPISALNSYVSGWSIKAVVTQKSQIRTTKGGKKFSSVVLQDESGEIKASMWGSDVDKLHETMEEGKQYIIHGGRIQTAKKQYNTTTHEYEINFNSSTSITPTGEADALPTKVYFNFTKLNQVSKKTTPTADIIAVIHEVGSTSTVVTKTTGDHLTKREIRIVDESGVSLELTTWGETAQNFPAAIGDTIAVKNCQVGEFQTITQLSVGRSSILQFNPEHPRSAELKAWYADHRGDNFVQAAASGEHESFKIPTIYLQQANDRHLGERTDKSDWFELYCVPKFIPISRPLYYMACPNPNCKGRKLVNQDGTFFCKHCEHTTEEPVPKFNFSCSVADFSGSMFASVLADDASGEAILGCTAAQWMQKEAELEEKDRETALTDYLRENVYFKEMHVKIWMKTDEYDGNTRKKAHVSRAYPIDYVKGAHFFFDEIQKFQ